MILETLRVDAVAVYVSRSGGRLPTRAEADALTFALADIRANWRYYRQDFIRSAR